MKLSIKAYDKRQDKHFSYKLKVEDKVLVTYAVLGAALITTGLYLKYRQ